MRVISVRASSNLATITKTNLLLINNFNMGGLKGMIRERIPASWLHVLMEEKCIVAYVGLVYKTHCGLSRTTPSNMPARIRRIKDAVRESNETGESRSFWISVNFLNLCTTREITKWYDVNRKIQNHKQSCR